MPSLAAKRRKRITQTDVDRAREQGFRIGKMAGERESARKLIDLVSRLAAQEARLLELLAQLAAARKPTP